MTTTKSHHSIGLFTILLLIIQTLGTKDSSPTITEHPINMSVSRNEPVTLGCSAKGEPEPRIEWYRNGIRVTTAPEDPVSHRILLPSGSLFFLRAAHSKKERDDGIYHCVARNQFGVARSSDATLEILYLRDEFRVSPQDVQASEGDYVVLKCSPPKGQPEPKVWWTKDGEEMQPDNKRIQMEIGGNLVIKSVANTDDGRYQCVAENSAAFRESRTVRLKIQEPPKFLSKPMDHDVLAGEDVLLACQADGDPFPVVEWSRRDLRTKSSASVSHSVTEAAANIRVIPGKGLRILSVHPSDEGVYECRASNLMGEVRATAALRVREKPVITVKPQAHLQIEERSEGSVTLNCLVTGTPKPAVFWTSEESDLLISPGTRVRNMYVNSDGALKIEEPGVEDSGHYVCSAVNAVGSAIARSHVVVYNENDYEKTSKLENGLKDEKLEEARLHLLENPVKNPKAFALDATSIRVNWKPSTKNRFLDGYRLYYRKRRTDRYEAFASAALNHAAADTYTVTRLEPATEYEIFVQPFYAGVIGLPSALMRVETMGLAPSAPPKLTAAKMVNTTTAFVSWEEPTTRGLVSGYQIQIWLRSTSDDSSSRPKILVNTSVAADRHHVYLSLPAEHLSLEEKYPLRVSALNGRGVGPAAEAFLSPATALEFSGGGSELISSTNDDLDNVDLIGYTWLMALAGSATFLAAVSVALFAYYRRQRGCRTKLASSDKDDPIPSFYAEATPGKADYNSEGLIAYREQQMQHNNPTLVASNSNRNSRQLYGGSLRQHQQQQLWIERRYNGGDDSCGEGSKLLMGGSSNNSSTTTSQPSNGSNNSSPNNNNLNENNETENEYAYIDRRNLSSFNNNRNSRISNVTAASPEPYASADILRRQQQQQQQFYSCASIRGGSSTPQESQYAQPLNVSSMLHPHPHQLNQQPQPKIYYPPSFRAPPPPPLPPNLGFRTEKLQRRGGGGYNNDNNNPSSAMNQSNPYNGNNGNSVYYGKSASIFTDRRDSRSCDNILGMDMKYNSVDVVQEENNLEGYGLRYNNDNDRFLRYPKLFFDGNRTSSIFGKTDEDDDLEATDGLLTTTTEIPPPPLFSSMSKLNNNNFSSANGQPRQSQTLSAAAAKQQPSVYTSQRSYAVSSPKGRSRIQPKDPAVLDLAPLNLPLPSPLRLTSENGNRLSGNRGSTYLSFTTPLGLGDEETEKPTRPSNNPRSAEYFVDSLSEDDSSTTLNSRSKIVSMQTSTSSSGFQ